MLRKEVWFAEIQVQLDNLYLKFIKYTIIFCIIKTKKNAEN